MSVNGLVIQLSAVALSFILVALLVVGSSRAAFVEENETVTERVPVGLSDPVPATGPAPAPRAPASSPSSSPSPSSGPPSPPAEAVPSTDAPPPLQQVDLTDDSAGTAMFVDHDGLVPGAPEQRCIRVTFHGDVDPAAVRLYAASASGALAPYLDLTVEMGPAQAGSFEDCGGFVPEAALFSGTLAAFGAGHGAYDTGLTTWDPVGPGESRTFRFTVAVQDDPAAEGLGAGFGFAWEARG